MAKRTEDRRVATARAALREFDALGVDMTPLKAAEQLGPSPRACACCSPSSTR